MREKELGKGESWRGGNEEERKTRERLVKLVIENEEKAFHSPIFLVIRFAA